MANFNFDLKIQRVYKEADGTPHVIAVASDSLPDVEDDRMSKMAIESMARQLFSGVDLIDSHKSTMPYGVTVGGSVNKTTFQGQPVYELIADIKLDMRFAHAQKLLECVEEGRCEYQLSIGGFIDRSVRNAVQVEQLEDGSIVRTINAITLDHIATTRAGFAANPRARFLSAIIKSLDDDNEVFVTKTEAEMGKKNKKITKSCPVCAAPCPENEIAKDNWFCKACYGTKDEYQTVIKTNNKFLAHGVMFSSYELDESESAWSFTEKDFEALKKQGWHVVKAAHTLLVPISKDSEQKDPSTPENENAYLLPHHKIDKENNLTTSFSGVIYSIAALINPDTKYFGLAKEQKEVAYAHLSRHLREFGITAPTFEEFFTYKSVEEFLVYVSRFDKDVMFAKTPLNRDIDDPLLSATKDLTPAASNDLDLAEKEKDIQKALSFFETVGKDLRTSKKNTEDKEVDIVKEILKTTKTEEATPQKETSKEVESFEKTEIPKESEMGVLTLEQITKSLEDILNTAKKDYRDEIGQTLKTYLVGFHSILLDNKVLKEDDLVSASLVVKSKETSEVDYKEMATTIGEQVVALMKDAGIGELSATVDKTVSESITENIEKGIKNSMPISKEDFAKLSEIMKSLDGRLTKVETVSGTKQSKDVNGPQDTPITKDVDPSNPFSGLFNQAARQALRVMK